jgi:hypothetical protein
MLEYWKVVKRLRRSHCHEVVLLIGWGKFRWRIQILENFVVDLRIGKDFEPERRGV